MYESMGDELFVGIKPKTLKNDYLCTEFVHIGFARNDTVSKVKIININQS